MPADAQMNGMMLPVCTCMVVFPPEDQSRQSWHHEMMSQGSLVLFLGGNYKRRAHPNLRAVIWVFWHWMFGSTDKPQTLYSGYLSVSHGGEHNQNELCVLFIHVHVPRAFWGTFSQYDFSCLMLAGQVTTCIPLNLLSSEAQITALWQWTVRVW